MPSAAPASTRPMKSSPLFGPTHSNSNSSPAGTSAGAVSVALMSTTLIGARPRVGYGLVASR